MDSILKNHPAVFYLVVIPAFTVLFGLFGYGFALVAAGGIR